MLNLTLISQVLTGSTPYAGCDDTTAMLIVQAGKTLQRPSDGISDPVWQFLEKCWIWNPQERPSATKLYDAFSRFHATQELPEKLKLEVRGIKIPFAIPKEQQFTVKVKYGNKNHTTPLTTKVVADEHTWFVFLPTLPLVLLLSLVQGRSANLVDRNRQTAR